ncbi:MAG: hypothetical protein U5R14_03450 [Gemmatimonadota bacterium]|nr:hypothetical protein [Gemmatimonadota bacterium]
MASALRTFLALVAGFVTATLGVLALSSVVALIFFDGEAGTDPGAAYIAFNLAYSFGFAVAGGWVAARLAEERPLLHGFLLAGVVISLSIPSAVEGPRQPGEPLWYPWVLMVIVGVGAPVGAWIRARREARVPGRDAGVDGVEHGG